LPSHLRDLLLLFLSLLFVYCKPEIGKIFWKECFWSI